MSTKVHVGRRDLKKSFHRLKEKGPVTVETPHPVYILLALYAVECGLKAVLLQQRGLHSTIKLDDDDDGGNLTHDIDHLLRAVQASPALLLGANHALIPSMQVGAGQLHEVYRYGGQLARIHETKLVQSLLKIMDYIQDNLESS